MRHSKFKSAVVLCLCLSVILFSCGKAAAEPAYPKFIKIGTGFPGGIWYPVSAILASELEDAFKEAGMDVHCSIQSTSGTYNLAAVNEGKEMQITLTTAQSQVLGFEGAEPFKEPLKNIRLVGTQELMLTQIVVPAGSDIQNIAQLKDKKVNGGKIASTDRMLMEALMKAYGMSFDDIKAAGGEVMGLGWEDAATMMQDGHMDFIGTYV